MDSFRGLNEKIYDNHSDYCGLKGDEEAENVFFGENAEILN